MSVRGVPLTLTLSPKGRGDLKHPLPFGVRGSDRTTPPPPHSVINFVQFLLIARVPHET